MDKLTALRAFRRVVERESFTRAAKDLALSPAAVSKNVRELEAELGAPLIHRTTRKLHLTRVGQGYYERTVAILDAMAAADRSVTELATASLRGHLRVAAPMSLGLALVGRAVNEFLSEHEGVEIELEMDDRAVDILNGGFDVTIRGSGALADSTLVAKKLGRIDRIAIASRDYLQRHGEPESPSDLAKHRCLVYSLSSAPKRWTFVKGTKRETVDVGGPLRINNSLALVGAAAAGVGVAFVPTVTAAGELAKGSVVPVLGAWHGEAQWLFAIHARHHESSRLVRAFVDHVARWFRSPSAG